MTPMNVLLINANTVKPPLSPIGLLYLSGYLKSQGVPVDIVDLGLHDGIASALEAAARRQPGLIGISLRNIDSTQMKLSAYFLPETLRAIAAIKGRFPGTPIVLGGAGFSLAPLEIMRLSDADYGVVGEGEAALYELVRKLSAGECPRSIAGLVYKTEAGAYAANPPRNAGRDFLKTLPFQDLDGVDYSLYYNAGGMASLQTKRGCALECIYCTYPIVEGRHYRLLDPKRIVDEMERFIARGYDYFHFSDSVFNVPRQHALEVCREIIRRALRVRWHTYMSPQGFDEELAGCLVQAGNDGVLFGADTCSERMLREHRKSFDKNDIARAAAACRKSGLEFSFHILFGAPGETMDTAQETLDALDALRPTAAFLTQGIRVYRGTPVHARLVREGKLTGAEDLLEPFFFMSELLPADFSRRIHDYAVARDFVFSDTTVKSPSTNAEIVELYKKGFRGPCWRVLRELGKGAKASGRGERA